MEPTDGARAAPSLFEGTQTSVDGVAPVPALASESRGRSSARVPEAADNGHPRRRFLRWRGLAAAVVLVACAIAAFSYFAGRESSTRYRTAAVDRGPVIATVSATGNLNAVVMVLVGSQVSGTIKELHADFNTAVRQGQVVARIDPALFEATVNQARADLDATQSTVLNQQAQLEQARTSLENAHAALAEGKAQTAKALVTVTDTRRTLGRQSELFTRGLVAAADRDSAETAYDSAVAQHESALAHERGLAAAIRTAEAQLAVQEAALATARNQVSQKQAALAQAQINLDHTTIRSPVDGVVVNRAVDVGQTVAASLQAPTLFTIARDLTRMQVETSVDEGDIGRIRADTPVTFTVDAFPGETFTGEVAQIRKAPQVAQNVVTYTVVVAVSNPGGKLLPGMTAGVRFLTARRDDVLRVPNTALRFRPPDQNDTGNTARPAQPAQAPAAAKSSVTQTGASGRVWALGRDGRPRPVAVTLGITDGTSTEVVRGDLAEGQEVLVGVESQTPEPRPSTGPGLRF